MSVRTTFVAIISFLITIQGVRGQYNDYYSGPSWGLIIGLSVGGMVLMMGLSALCFYCPLCCLYKMRNSRGAVTYTNARPGTVGTVTAVTPYPQQVYPGGTMAQQQPGMYPSGTVYVQGGHVGHVVSQGTVFAPGNTQGSLPYPQGAVITPQGQQQYPQGAVITPQGQYQYPQGAVLTPQGQHYYTQEPGVSQPQQGAPPPYSPTRGK